MSKPSALIFSGYGLNCEEETKTAFEIAGVKSANIVHINDLIAGSVSLNKYQIIAFPGGFSYGDDTGSGNAYANKLKNHLWEKIKNFVEKEHLVIGICNGFQILVNLGLLPAFDGKYGERQAALLHNDSARYIVKWVDLKVENNSPWLNGIDNIALPIAHGEGKFYASDKVLKKLNEKKLTVMRYINNPNGALENIAAITDISKRVIGMMPHPERNIFFEQLPDWTYQKAQLEKKGKIIPKYSDGLKIFQNAVHYFK